MDSIGTKLKEARATKGISIDQAQKDTHIHHRILLALENDRPEQAVSGVIYIKSFIKKYADYLGLDGALISEEYRAESQKSTQKFSVGKSESSRFNFPVKSFLAAAIILLIALLAGKFLFFAGSKISAALKSRPKIEKKEEAPKKTKKIDKPEGENNKRSQSLKQAQQAVVAQTVKPPVAVSPPQVSKNEEINLSIKTRGDTYLKIKSDGSLVYEGILKKGSSEIWRADQSLEIATGRAEFIDAELNGGALPSFGKGVVKEILITRSGLKLPN